MRKAMLALWAVALTASAVAGDLYVLPVVADGVAGRFGSLWETQIRIVKVNAADTVVIRRAWVCLEGGGFVDDPGTAPTWELEEANSITGGWNLDLTAADVLAGTGAQLGGVALDVEGGALLIDVSIVDVSVGGFAWGGPPLPYGIGQTYGAARAPLEGASHLSWIGGCYGYDIRQHCDDKYRNNVGLLNPNPQPLVVELEVIQFADTRLGGTPGATAWLPPFGWRQADFPLNEPGSLWTPFQVWSFPRYGVMNLQPQSDLPYYAYVSVVYTSPEGATIPRVSDPSFQLAQPGQIVY